MSPLAKRCKVCRKKFKDKVSHDIKKKKRKEVSKEKTMKKVEEQGLDTEFAKRVKKELTKPESPYLDTKMKYDRVY